MAETINYSVPDFLTEGKKEIEGNLVPIMDREFDRVAQRWPHAAELFPDMKGYLMREGKRVRPILTMASYKGFGGVDTSAIMDVAVATEFLHAAYLVTDDFYDEDPGLIAQRGGKIALHLSYGESFRGRTPGDSNWDPDSFSKHATSAAVHLYLAMAGRLINSSGISPEDKVRAIGVYMETIEDGTLGQAMDILSKSKPFSEVTEAEVIALELARSASYAFRFPLVMGAVCAGANDSQVSLLSDYGFKIGLAYQIQDDVIGLFGASESGKVQNEIAEGKRTLLIQKALELGDDEQTHKLLTLLKKRTPDGEDLEAVRKIVKECGAYDVVMKYADELLNSGSVDAAELSVSDQFTGQLKQLSEFVTHRTK